LPARFDDTDILGIPPPKIHYYIRTEGKWTESKYFYTEDYDIFTVVDWDGSLHERNNLERWFKSAIIDEFIKEVSFKEAESIK
jgi:hypothetical protein